MDMFQVFSNIVIPRWVKGTIAGTLLSLLAITLIVGFFGIAGTKRQEDWLEASMYLFGVLLPIWLIVFVVMYADGGTSALKTKTYDYMTKIIPASFKSIVEEPTQFYVAGKKTKRRTMSKVKVLTNQYRDSCICRYILEFPDRLPDELASDGSKQKTPPPKRGNARIYMSLELNVKKANLVLHVPADIAHEQLGKSSLTYDEISTLFPHTLTGANAEGYVPNKSLQQEQLGGRNFYGLVFIKQLNPNFLTLPAEKLYFAQDLMFMLKAFYNENTLLFRADPTRKTDKLDA